MLNESAKKSSALLIDSRISSSINFEGSSSDHSFLEQQFEFLRNLLTSRRFRGAVEYVLRNPHSKLREIEVRQSIRKPVRTGREFSRQMNRGTNRIQLPSGHPISNRLTSVPETIVKVERIDDFDTPENRFVKLVLEDFRSTLLSITNLLSSE